MDQILQQLSLDCIFSAPYHSQSNGKLECISYVSEAYTQETQQKGSNQLG